MLVAVTAIVLAISVLAYHLSSKAKGSGSVDSSTTDRPPQWEVERVSNSGNSQDSKRRFGNSVVHPRNHPDNAPQSEECEVSPDTTPKGRPLKAARDAVPSFILDASSAANEHASDDDAVDGGSHTFPAENSPQRVSATINLHTPPKLKPLSNGILVGDSQLMPPPQRKQGLVTVASPNARLRAIQPLKSRLVPDRGLMSSSLMPPPSTTTYVRNKTVLKPGHSPLDWAHLQRSSKNLSGVDSMQRVTPARLKEQNGRKGRPAWASYQGRVYNLTPYIPFHPGGEGEIRRTAGKDGEKLFLEVHPWVNWENMLGECLVGILVNEKEVFNEAQDQDLEGID